MIKGSSCPAEIPLNDDEIDAGLTAADILWDCSDENNPSSVCTKTCPSGFIPSGSKQVKSCECTKKCDWKQPVASCVPAICTIMDDNWWPSRVSCFDKSDNRIVTDTDPDTILLTEFPEGAYCMQEQSWKNGVSRIR